jgi:hypothetical protein
MQQEKERFIPVVPNILSAIGLVLVGVGLAKHIRGVDVIPVQFRFENYQFVLIAAGAALLVPALIHIVRKFSANADK